MSGDWVTFEVAHEFMDNKKVIYIKEFLLLR